MKKVYAYKALPFVLLMGIIAVSTICYLVNSDSFFKGVFKGIEIVGVFMVFGLILTGILFVVMYGITSIEGD